MWAQEAYLNGEALSLAHPLILIQDIQETPVSMSQQTARRPVAGSFLTLNTREQLAVTITFATRERLDVALRQQIVQAAALWASAGGWLTLSSRPDQRLWVQPTALPSVGKLREWNASLTITLTAYEYPYWVDTYPRTTTVTGTSGETEITVATGAETVLEAEATASGSITRLSLIADNAQTLALTGLSVASGTALRVWYDEHHLLRITAGDTGLMNKRTAASDDDIRLTPGTHTIAWSANRSISLKLQTRGVWL